MSAEIIFGTDFSARRDREAAQFRALSEIIAGDQVFVDIDACLEEFDRYSKFLMPDNGITNSTTGE